MTRIPTERERDLEHLAHYKRMMKLYHAKLTKEMMLHNIRRLEKKLGLKSHNYNSREFSNEKD